MLRERAVVLRVLLLERVLLERVLELRGELLRRVFWLVAIGWILLLGRFVVSLLTLSFIGV